MVVVEGSSGALLALIELWGTTRNGVLGNPSLCVGGRSLALHVNKRDTPKLFAKCLLCSACVSKSCCLPVALRALARYFRDASDEMCCLSKCVTVQNESEKPQMESYEKIHKP